MFGFASKKEVDELKNVVVMLSKQIAKVTAPTHHKRRLPPVTQYKPKLKRQRGPDTIDARLLRVMENTGRKYSATTLAEVLGAKRQSICAALSKFYIAGVVNRVAPGIYQIADQKLQRSY